jgi:hypothetical protein
VQRKRQALTLLSPAGRERVVIESANMAKHGYSKLLEATRSYSNLALFTGKGGKAGIVRRLT